MKSILQIFGSGNAKPDFRVNDTPSNNESPEQPDQQKDVPAPVREPGTQPPGTDPKDPKTGPVKEFDPEQTRQDEIDLPKHEDDQKGYAEIPREDILPEFNNGAKDRGNSAESSGDPAHAFAEK